MRSSSWIKNYILYANLSIQIYSLKNKFYFIHKKLLIKINLKLISLDYFELYNVWNHWLFKYYNKLKFSKLNKKKYVYYFAATFCSKFCNIVIEDCCNLYAIFLYCIDLHDVNNYILMTFV